MVSASWSCVSLVVCVPLLNTAVVGVAPETLECAATLLIGIGLAIVLPAILVHWRREGANPFRPVVVRGSRLTPVLVLVPALGYLLASALVEPLRRELEQSGGTEAARIGLNSLTQTIGGLLCLWVGMKCFRGGLRGFLLGRQGMSRPVAAALVYLLAAGALCELTALATQWWFCLFDPDHVFTEHQVLEALRDPAEPGWAPVVLWLGAVVVAPVAEECFFRGMLQTMLLRALRIRWLAVVAPALLFGLAHSSQPHVVPAMVLFGVILGIQYERSGGLAGPIALHAMFNFKTLVWEWLAGGAVGV